jgi:hypothetical protein
MTLSPRFSPLAGILVMGGAAACATFVPADALRPQAAFDLQCPADQLSISVLSGDCGKQQAGMNDYDCTLGVTGCGKQTTYSHLRNTETWAANAPHNSGR